MTNICFLGPAPQLKHNFQVFQPTFQELQPMGPCDHSITYSADVPGQSLGQYIQPIVKTWSMFLNGVRMRCFAAQYVRDLSKIEGEMKKEDYQYYGEIAISSERRLAGQIEKAGGNNKK
ncbi:hypothetical protein C0J52_23535 [Blattella germanica]|nr:hypothetical protein C0J52_23535 [Blattella germanica]